MNTRTTRASSTSSATAPAVVNVKKKQAVVVIHGMGEQRPMSTLRGFVEAVWTTDHFLSRVYFSNIDPGAVPPNQSWISPDAKTGSYEQRRITTPYDINGRRTDFFEIYWADITQGTTRERLYAWMKSLLWRKRADIPADAVRLYWATALFALLLLVATVVLGYSFWQGWVVGWKATLITAAAAALFWLVDQFVLPYFGDVASYVRAEPGTVEKRAEVRERGLALLRKLSDDDSYDRIVLVSHSLGSIIAYDLLQILWAERRPWNLHPQRDAATLAAARNVGAVSHLPSQRFETWTAPQLDTFRQNQWALYKILRNRKRSWKISDFVTLGSPLTHAEFLVAQNKAEWQTGVLERQFAICPPLSDNSHAPTILFNQGRDRLGVELSAIHHGAAFAATRWINIYDIGNLLTTGDPISGHMWENFGPGVDNVLIEIRRARPWPLKRLFTHTLYWSLEAVGGIHAQSNDMPHISMADDDLGLTERDAFRRFGKGHIAALRSAIDLARRAGDDEVSTRESVR